MGFCFESSQPGWKGLKYRCWDTVIAEERCVQPCVVSALKVTQYWPRRLFYCAEGVRKDERGASPPLKDDNLGTIGKSFITGRNSSWCRDAVVASREGGIVGDKRIYSWKGSKKDKQEGMTFSRFVELCLVLVVVVVVAIAGSWYKRTTVEMMLLLSSAAYCRAM